MDSLPATEAFLNNLYSSVLDPVASGMDVLLNGLRETGKSGLMKFLTFRQEADQFRKKYSNFRFFFIDEISSDDEITAWSQLADQMDIELSDKVSLLVPKIVSHTETLTTKENQTLVIFLNQVMKWRFMSDDLVNNLWIFKRRYEDKVKFVVISDSCTGTSDEDINNKFPFLKLTEVWFPMYSKEDVRHQITRNRNLANMNMKGIDLDVWTDKIYGLGGGIGGITKKLSLLSLEDMKKGTNDILKISSVFYQVLNTLIDTESRLLDKLKSQKYDKELHLSGLTDKDGKIMSEILKLFVSKYDIKKYRSLGDLPKDLLSPQELDVYTMLRDRKGKILTREEIAKILWEDQYAEKYSDWAIDALISRIRKKLPTEKIVTAKGKGIYWEK